MKEQEVVTLMKSSQSATQWDENCTKVKRACNGYPRFWHAAIISSGVADEVAKKFGGSTDIKATGCSRRPINNMHGRPTMMPYLASGEQVIGVYDQGLGEKDMPCKTLGDMQSLYDSYYQGMALTLEWFIESRSEIKIPSH